MKSDHAQAPATFIVEFWAKVFSFLGELSLFTLVRKVLPGAISGTFVDAWVLGHMLLALLAVVLAVNLPPLHWLSITLAIYGFARVFEISVYQTNVLLFDEYRTARVSLHRIRQSTTTAVEAQQTDKPAPAYAVISYRRLVLLLLHNYFEIIFWLGCTYTVLAGEYLHKWQDGTGTFMGALYSSFITMTTFGEFDLMPQSRLAAGVLLFHATVGLFMTLLSLARFISLLPAPRSTDKTEQG